MPELDFDLPLRQPSPCLCSRRGSRYLLYAPATPAVTVVNEAGQDVWALFESPRTPREAVRIRGAKQAWTRPLLAEFLGFIERLLAAGFLVSATPAAQVAAVPAARAETANEQLSEVYLHITNRCNLRCVYCFNAEYRAQGSAEDELTAAEIRRVLAQLAALSARRVVFSGGEPLLRNDCLPAARYARSLGLATSCLTNGTLLENRAVEVAEAFEQVIVSLDSWRAEEQETARPGGRLAAIVRGVRRLVATGRTRVWIRPVITRINLDSLPGFPQFAASELRCTDFMLALCSATNRQNLDNLGLLPDLETYRQKLQEFHAAVASVGGSSTLVTDPLYTVGRCGAGTGLLSIAPNGDVFPCQLLHVPELQAGNVREATVSAIWQQSQVLLRMRGQEPPRFPACRQCPIIKLCSLTCRAVHQAFGQEADRYTSAMCPFARLEAEERLWKEAERPGARMAE